MSQLDHSPIRVLWLNHGGINQPEPVRYPASEQDVRLALRLFEYAFAYRSQIADRIRRVLHSLETIPAIARGGIPARFPDGIYRPISWRFALWLSVALRAEGSELLRLKRELVNWLSGQAAIQTLSTPPNTSKQVTGQ